jgi:hypothetical protein
MAAMERAIQNATRGTAILSLIDIPAPNTND